MIEKYINQNYHVIGISFIIFAIVHLLGLCYSIYVLFDYVSLDMENYTLDGLFDRYKIVYYALFIYAIIIMLAMLFKDKISIDKETINYVMDGAYGKILISVACVGIIAVYGIIFVCGIILYVS